MAVRLGVPVWWNIFVSSLKIGILVFWNIFQNSNWSKFICNVLVSISFFTNTWCLFQFLGVDLENETLRDLELEIENSRQAEAPSNRLLEIVTSTIDQGKSYYQECQHIFEILVPTDDRAADNSQSNAQTSDQPSTSTTIEISISKTTRIKRDDTNRELDRELKTVFKGCDKVSKRLTGWIQGDYSFTPELFDQMVELRRNLSKMKQKYIWNAKSF